MGRHTAHVRLVIHRWRPAWAVDYFTRDLATGEQTTATAYGWTPGKAIHAARTAQHDNLSPQRIAMRIAQLTQHPDGDDDHAA